MVTRDYSAVGSFVYHTERLGHSTHLHVIRIIDPPPGEDQCEWHRMTRMTGPECAVMCNLINTHTHTHTHTHIHASSIELNGFKSPVLSTCPLHTNSGCGKERRILIGPW